jgi:hypothetical protein
VFTNYWRLPNLLRVDHIVLLILLLILVLLLGVLLRSLLSIGTSLHSDVVFREIPLLFLTWN